MALDRTAVAHIATLARIKVPEGELDALARELDGILHWVEQLGEVDTSGVEPMSSVTGNAMPRFLTTTVAAASTPIRCGFWTAKIRRCRK